MSTDSTTAEVRDASTAARGRIGRRVTVALLALLVLLGAAGLFGVHSSSVTARSPDYTLTVDYARFSRAGLDTPWTVTVAKPAGFDGPITLATTATYFGMFETQGFSPEPETESVGDGVLYQTFEPPRGARTFTLSYDAYIQPASQLGRGARTTLIAGTTEIAHVDYKTWLAP